MIQYYIVTKSGAETETDIAQPNPFNFSTPDVQMFANLKAQHTVLILLLVP